LEHVLRIFLPFALLLPLAEIAVLIVVGQRIGVAAVLALLLLGAVTGMGLLRWQGRELMRQMRSAFAGDELPLAKIYAQLPLALAGILFLLPGFLSDFIAILLLLRQLPRLLQPSAATNPDRFSGPDQFPGPRRRPSIIDAEAWEVKTEDDAQKRDEESRLQLQKRGSSRPEGSPKR
jgi:UPF0716 family protein affecting phage T7 exclusion